MKTESKYGHKLQACGRVGINYIYDAAGAKLKMSVTESGVTNTTDYVNGFVYENTVLSFFGSPEGRVVKNGSALDYQYAIADHQGNTRIVFTSATPTATAKTTNFEGSTSADFQNYTNRTNWDLFDHTDPANDGTDYSQKLTGGVNSQVGVTRSMKVFPGDRVKIEAYAKYYNAQSTASNLSGFALALTGAFGVSSSSTGEALKAYNSLNSYGGIIAAGNGGGNSNYPKLFVNILLFDKDFKLLDAAWQQIDGGEQVGATPKATHDYMMKEVTVKEAGYAYVFVSNESATLVEFYVDDVVVTLTPNNVIQYNEYYPFGLQTAASWTRENTTANNYLYNAANELNQTSGWYEMFYRGYDPATGRMLQIDPYATLYASSTTYNYALNNPVMMNDPDGAQTSVAGLSDMQVRSMYRNDFYNHGYSGNFGDWAFDNLDFGGGGSVVGPYGQIYGVNSNGQFGEWKLVDAYDIGLVNDGKLDVDLSIEFYKLEEMTNGGGAGDPLPEYRMFGSDLMDIFIEQIVYSLNSKKIIRQNIVFMEFNKDGKMVNTTGIQRTIVETEKNQTIEYSEVYVSPGLEGVIETMENFWRPLDVVDKYWDFITTPTGNNMLGIPINERKNKLKIISSQHR